MLAINRGDKIKALEVANGVSSYDGAQIRVLQLRAWVYTHAGQAGQAEQILRRALGLKAYAAPDVAIATAQLGLGRVLALQQKTADAHSAYQDFFAMWKDADPDIPILHQARAEYAKLK